MRLLARLGSPGLGRESSKGTQFLAFFFFFCQENIIYFLQKSPSECWVCAHDTWGTLLLVDKPN